jgi:hypothetical protein
MKKMMFLSSALLLIIVFLNSCNKKECHACHYDGPSGEVELGEKCDEELEALEAQGYYTVSGTNYTVHCGEEH